MLCSLSSILSTHKDYIDDNKLINRNTGFFRKTEILLNTFKIRLSVKSVLVFFLLHSHYNLPNMTHFSSSFLLSFLLPSFSPSLFPLPTSSSFFHSPSLIFSFSLSLSCFQDKSYHCKFITDRADNQNIYWENKNAQQDFMILSYVFLCRVHSAVFGACVSRDEKILYRETEINFQGHYYSTKWNTTNDSHSYFHKYSSSIAKTLK